jgi:hypothetical protein
VNRVPAWQGGRGAVAQGKDLVDGSVDQAVGHAVLVAKVPGNVSQVDLKFGKRKCNQTAFSLYFFTL